MDLNLENNDLCVFMQQVLFFVEIHLISAIFVIYSFWVIKLEFNTIST